MASVKFLLFQTNQGRLSKKEKKKKKKEDVGKGIVSRMYCKHMGELTDTKEGLASEAVEGQGNRE